MTYHTNIVEARRARSMNDRTLVQRFEVACMEGSEMDHRESIRLYREELLRRLQKTSRAATPIPF